jgi:hypothetical protein
MSVYLLLGVGIARGVTINAGIPGSSDVASPAGIVANFYQFAVFFGGLVAFAVIVYAGVRYTLAAGNPSTQSDARDQITQALLGLLMLLGVYLLLNVINPDLVKLSMPELEKIKLSGGSAVLHAPDSQAVCGCKQNEDCQLNNGIQQCVPITIGTSTPGTISCNPMNPASCPAGKKCSITDINTGATACK